MTDGKCRPRSTLCASGLAVPKQLNSHLGNKVNNAGAARQRRRCCYGELAEHAMRFYRALPSPAASPEQLPLPLVATSLPSATTRVHPATNRRFTRCKLD